MTISLPCLWIAGHLAAPFGLVLFIVHLFWRDRIVSAVCIGAALLSCLLLAVIFDAIDRSFFGLYRWLAWVIAFFAGYAVATPVAYAAWLITRLVQNRYATPAQTAD